MLDTLRSSTIFRRTIWTAVLVVFVSSAVVIVQRIIDDFNGWVEGSVVAVLALATFKPIIMNILWALRVTFVLPLKWGKALGDWLDMPEEAT